MPATSPLLPVGTFGVHLIQTSETWSFAGTIPSTIQRGGYATEQAAITAFITWFKAQDLAFQRAHVGDLRTDVFTLLLGAMA